MRRLVEFAQDKTGIVSIIDPYKIPPFIARGYFVWKDGSVTRTNKK